MEDLIKKRGHIKGKLTRFANFVNAFNPESDLADLQTRFETATSLLERFEEIQGEIERYSEEDLLDETVVEVQALAQRSQREAERIAREELERAQFENIYYKHIGKARTLLRTRSETPSISGTTNPTSETQASDSARTVGVNLPKITLPTFDGDYSDWLKFRDTFTSLIHEHPTLTNIQKFHYLNSALSGDAASTIASLGLSDANYQIAWRNLKSRYEDSNALVHHHVQSLFEAPSLPRDATHKEVRQLLDNTNNHLMALSKLVGIEQWDPLVIYLIVSKLNAILRREWEKVVMSSTTQPTYKRLSEFSEGQCKLLQKLESCKSTSDKNNKITQRGQAKGTATRAYPALEKQISCAVCKESHPIYSCTEFKQMPVSTRLETIKSLKYCFNCLQGGHRNKDCKSGPCKKCGKRHNSLLHLEKTAQYSSSTQNAEEVTAQRDQADASDNHLALSSRI